ncbi:hypothetical protein DFR58_13416 [Anaerobacterium chartisolvens]|uniref:Uncharacterized protein n=1 Tax=Anaerobacterium chartisolvens TaxID=1297424 RepID=A0A369AJQ2_9FIRM|nr:hypothetical protein [Anaerobacterium chartisolvens]RCX09612.1 hypothetical protein DFR58_13416 [Anaerobacterium chartisolvens]
MKKNKKLVMAVSFCVGFALLGTTAFADIASRTGYDELKDAAKTTAAALEEKVQSFTFEASFILKDNNQVLSSQSSVSKTDNANQRSAHTSVSHEFDGSKTESRSYRDQNSRIYYNSVDDTYYVTEFTSPIKNSSVFNNPFDEERAKDVEKIIDALVGGLKDYVVVDEKPDGSRELSGSLSEAQIPALVNAVSSFGIKQMVSERVRSNDSMPLPQIAEDIFVKSIKGNALVNKEGIVESVLASGILSGKDKDGVSHDLTMEILLKLTDINTTLVEKPDLSGKNVQTHKQASEDENRISAKHIGKYKSDIVIEKDGVPVKIGERIIDVQNVAEKTLSAKYHEVYKEEYADEYGTNITEFNINGEIQNSYNVTFEYKDSFMELSEIYFDPSGIRLHLGGSFSGSFDSMFSRVFD